MKIPLKLNTLTSYMNVFVRFVEGFMVVRWMVGLMGKDLYGLWGILWALFSYAVLLDFGFGFTAQKYTAGELYRTDMPRYNRIISTVFSFHSIMALILMGVVVIVSFYTNNLFHVQEASAATQSLCHKAFLFFGIGAALIFPTTMASGVLIGLHCLYIKNAIDAISKIVEFLGIVLIFQLHKYLHASDAVGFIVLICFMLFVMLLTNLAKLTVVYRKIPGVRLFMGLDRESFRSIFSFSGYVYLVSMSRLVVNTLTGLMVGACVGLMASGSFQIAKKLPQIMQQLTTPYQENVSPITARLYAHSKQYALGEVMLGFMRWNSLISSALCAVVLAFVPEIMRFAFKVEGDQLAVDICRVMLVSLWLDLSLRTVPLSSLIMAGKHRTVSLSYIIEAVLTIVTICLVLVHFKLSIFWLPICSLTIRMIASFGLLLPALISATNLTLWRILYRIIIQPLYCVGFMYIAILAYKRAYAGISDFWLLAFGGIIGVGTYFIAAWGVILTKEEQNKVESWLPKPLQKHF